MSINIFSLKPVIVALLRRRLGIVIFVFFYNACLLSCVNAQEKEQALDLSQQLASVYVQFDLKVITPPDDPNALWHFKIEAGDVENAVEMVLDADVTYGLSPVKGQWRTYRFDFLTISKAGSGIDLRSIDKLMVFPTWGAGKGASFRLDNMFVGTLDGEKPLVFFTEQENPQWPAWDCCGGSVVEFISDEDPAHGQVAQFKVNNGNGGTVLGFNTLQAEQPATFDVSLLLNENTINAVKEGTFVKQEHLTTLHFSHLESEELSAIGTIYSVIKDSQGFMWFGGSDGLARYDGYSLKIYKHDIHDPDSLSNNSVWHILEDRNGRLWIATDVGINVLDTRLQKFTHFVNDPGDVTSLSHNLARIIMEDADGGLWIGTYGGGLNRFEPETQGFVRFLNEANNPNSISNNIVNTIIEDHTGILWIGTNQGLNRFDRKTQEFTHYSSYWGDQHSLNSSSIRTIKEDSEHRLWVGTFTGLNLFDRATEKATRYQFENLDFIDIVDLDFDPQNRLWIASGEALLIFDPETLQFSRFLNNPFKQSSFKGKYPASIFQDQNNNWWMGTFPGGINYVDHSKNLFTTYQKEPDNKDSLNHNSVLAITDDKQGNLWLGTDGGGLNYLDRTSGEFTHYIANPLNQNSISANAVLSVSYDQQDNLWIGAWHAPLSIFNPQQNRFIHETANRQGHELPDTLYVWTSYQDSQGDMWLGTTGNGLIKYEQKNNRYISYVPVDNEENSFASLFVWAVFEDRQGQMWFGTSNGLEKFIRHENRFEHYRFHEDDPNSLSNDIVLAISEDQQGHLWVGTRGGGLNKLHKERGKFSKVSRQDGLPDDVITAILNDDLGYLWLSTFNGLCRFELATNKCINFSNIGGLLSNKFNIGAARKLNSGELVFGSTGGFTLFNPADIKSNNNVPLLAFTDFQIANRPVKIGVDGSPLGQDISHIQQIVLNHQQSMFSIEFAALDYQNPGKNQYAYFLDGYDQQWNEIGHRRRATYTNLDPGEYLFKVKGSNSEGVWNNEGISVAVKVLPPPWKSWWAISFYIVSLLTILFLIASLQINKLQERRRLKLALWASGDELWNVDLFKGQVLRQNNLKYLARSHLDSWLITGVEDSYIYPEDRDKVQQEFAACDENFEVTYRAKTKAGEWIWLQERGKVTAKNQQGEPLRISGTTKNIDRLKTTEAQLLSLNQELEHRVERRTQELQQSNEYLQSTQAQLVESEKMASLGTVVVGVSHELNTPLGIAVTALSNLKHQVGNLVALMEAGKLSKNAFNQFIENANSSTDLAYSSMTKSVSIIQSFRKISVDQANCHLNTNVLKELIEFSVSNAQSDSQNTDHIVEIHCPPELEITTYSDVVISTLKQLFNNARDHGFSADEAINIKITATDQKEGTCIVFEDNGKGMTEEELAKIFDPFYTTDRGAYIGLGMFVVYNQVNHLLKGSIRCESVPGKGTWFTLFLPRKTQG